MTWLGVKLLFMLLTMAVCFYLSSSLDASPVVSLRYLKESLVGTEDTSLRLTCKAEYNRLLCGQIKAYWCRHSSQNCGELLDPMKYLTVVNETKLVSDDILRQVDIVFKQLALADQGVYQCHAKCDIDGHSALGHFINITVKAAPIVNIKNANDGGPNRTYNTGLVLFSLVILEIFQIHLGSEQ
ncbi:hypothetical protein DPEC_G00158250 [Dallia pectoralis]|uniref:Uncharacterized protein n=1 Tax=Dallia pectoralis TaxID=75939 RepID=A0ACC2GKS2_DALPE|nr:hypothetical protein DPEC_G00158250 [Dallia pectoralis]